ncbi:cupin [Streptomyces sp. NPDC058766]|uniref:cupin n=1 Tax=Streptomyces sp. NPDC058766 TaxID=3346630 RepID=UPI0036AF2B11
MDLVAAVDVDRQRLDAFRAPPGDQVAPMVRGDLRVTVLVQNGGLPEAGDAVFTFPPEVLADPERYAAAAALPPGTGPETAAPARRRRDLAVEGYLALREALVAGDTAPYREFQRPAARLVRDRVPARVPARRELWRIGALADAERTGAQRDALAAGDPGHLAEATAHEAAPARLGGFGRCGRRDEYVLPGTTLPHP